MTIAAYRHALEREIGALGVRIAKAEAKLETGAPQEKVRAAGELAELRAWHDGLQQKLARFEKEGESGWDDVKSGLAEEIRKLAAAFERWADRRS